MTIVLISIVALAAGPLVHHFARSFRAALAALDGFVLVTVGGLVLLRLLPQALRVGGLWAAGAALLGFLAIGGIERVAGPRAGAARSLAVVLATLGFALHEALDGVALAASQAGGHNHDHLLPLAITLHRVPIGLAVWWLVRPTYGVRAALTALAGVALAIATGWLVGTRALEVMSGREVALFQGLAGGALLHIIVHRPGGPEATGARWASGLGALAAAGVLLAMAETELGPAIPTGELSASTTFLALATSAAPTLLLAFLCAGLLHELLPTAGVAWLSRGGRLAQAARGIAVGAPVPICSCGVQPLYRSLLARGAPAAAGLALLLTAPALGLDALFLSVPLLGGALALLRLGAALLLALLVAVLVAPLARSAAATVAPASPPTRPVGSRLLGALRIGFGEVVDHSGPWLLVGLGAAALVEPYLPLDLLTRIPSAAQVPLLALLGVPIYLCATGATPLVAILIHKGISPGAALAFLLTGPAMSISTFATLAALHGQRAAAAFAAAVFALAVALGLGLDAALAPGAGLDLHALGTQAPGRLAAVFVAALAALLAASLVRQGARGFLGQILSVRGRDHAHEHGPADHDHHHDHHHHDPDHAHHH
ncbi:MAG: permease [Deltaproteobacteria bacterium]|nr:permease [Deltaproteobacteria bacterium]